MKQHPRIFTILFIMGTLLFFVIGVYLEITGKTFIGIISWLVAMIMLIYAINCIWDSKKKKF